MSDDVKAWLAPGVMVWVRAWGPGYVYEVERVPVGENALVPLKSRQSLAQVPRKSLCRAATTGSNDFSDQHSTKRTKGVGHVSFNSETIAAVRICGMDEEALLTSLHKAGIVLPEMEHAHTEWCCESFDVTMLIVVVDTCAAMMKENFGGSNYLTDTCGSGGIAQWKNIAYRVLGLLTLRTGQAPNSDLVKLMVQGDLKYRQSLVILPFPAYAYPVYQAMDEAKGMLPLDSELCREKALSEHFGGDQWVLYGADFSEPDWGANRTISLGDILGQRELGNSVFKKPDGKNKEWNPQPEVGVGGDGQGWARVLEVIFRGVSSVKNAAHSLD